MPTPSERVHCQWCHQEIQRGPHLCPHTNPCLGGSNSERPCSACAIVACPVLVMREDREQICRRSASALIQKKFARAFPSEQVIQITALARGLELAFESGVQLGDRETEIRLLLTLIRKHYA